MLAVRLYNDSMEARAFEGFVVHMHLAWLYLLHAELTEDGVDIRYRRRDQPRLLDRIDGEPKTWGLRHCVAHRWSENDAVRKNIELFIGLRNKIEHRYAARTQLALNSVLSGHAQAFLLNYEAELTERYGTKVSLATALRFPVFVGSFTQQGEAALLRMRRTLPAPLRNFVAEYYAALDDDVANDPRFELRLRVINELAPKDPNALALQFTRLADMSAEERRAAEELARTGKVIIREQVRGVINLDARKPSEVVAEVAPKIPFMFTMGQFTKAWRTLGIRPPANTPHPERTDERYCSYDSRHNDYGYTQAYVKKLVKDCSTEAGFRRTVGLPPRDRETGDWVGEPPTNSQPPWSKPKAAPSHDDDDDDFVVSPT